MTNARFERGPILSLLKLVFAVNWGYSVGHDADSYWLARCSDRIEKRSGQTVVPITFLHQREDIQYFCRTPNYLRSIVPNLSTTRFFCPQGPLQSKWRMTL